MRTKRWWFILCLFYRLWTTFQHFTRLTCCMYTPQFLCGSTCMCMESKIYNGILQVREPISFQWNASKQVKVKELCHVNIGTPWEIWDPWFSYSQESGDPGPYITNRMKTQGPHFPRNMGIPLWKWLAISQEYIRTLCMGDYKPQQYRDPLVKMWIPSSAGHFSKSIQGPSAW